MVVYGIIGFFVFLCCARWASCCCRTWNYKSFVDPFADLLGPAAGFFSWGGRTGSHGWSPGPVTSSRSPAMPGFGGLFANLGPGPGHGRPDSRCQVQRPPLRELSLARIDQGRCHRKKPHRRRRDPGGNQSRLLMQARTIGRTCGTTTVLPNGFPGVVSGFQIAFFAAYIGARWHRCG